MTPTTPAPSSHPTPAPLDARPTVPARDSFEEAQLDLVRLGKIDIAEARRAVELYRELREGSAARFLYLTSKKAPKQ